MYNSSQMLIEAKRNKEVGCIIGHFFLCYYALFHAMQSLLFLNPNLDSEKVLDLSHNEVKKYFEDFYCKGNNSIMPPEIIDIFVVLKEYRELYSYTMPFNNPQNVMIEMEHLEYYITLCFQLLSLKSFIIYKIRPGTIAFDNNVKEYFENCCYKVSAKYCYAIHELRLHQNDRCKRFTLCLVLTVRFRSLAPWGKLFQLFI